MQYKEIPLQRLDKEFTPFSPERPQIDEALYYGFDEALDNHHIGLAMTCDGTGGMSWSGQVRLHVPQMAQREIGGVKAYWVRCKVVEPSGEQRGYATSPILREVDAVTWGGTVGATHATIAARPARYSISNIRPSCHAVRTNASRFGIQIWGIGSPGPK